MTCSGALLRDCRKLPVFLWAKLSIIFAAALSCSVLGVPSGALAQQIIATVNGRPITDLDLGQRMKLLRVLRKPATRDAAMQSLVDDQLELQETALYQIKPTDAQIGQEIARTAKQMKVDPQALFGELQRSGISEAHIKEHFSATLSFYSLVQAFHKGVEASQSQVNAELAKEGGKAAVTQYRVRQVIFVIPTSMAKNMAAVKGRMDAAEQLRTRFSDCTSGLPLAGGMDNVAVREEVIRDSSQLSEPVKQLLDKTPTGHLTPPQRSPEGVEMIAVCGKSASNDEAALRSEISQRLIAAEIEADAQKRLSELRAHAVIAKK